MNKKMILMILAGVLVGGGAAAAYFLVFASSPAQSGAVSEVEKGPAGLVSMETFLVNVSDGTEERFAKLQLRLTVHPFNEATKINEDELLQAKMRDRVLTLLASKSFRDLSTPIGKEGFRREIKTVLEPILPEGQIDEVLFQEFVVQ